MIYHVRESAYGPFVRALDRELAPVHEIALDGAPIHRIQRIPDGLRTRFVDLWKRQARAGQALRAIAQRAAADPALAAELARALDAPDARETFRAALPDELRVLAEDALWLLVEDGTARKAFENQLRSVARSGAAVRSPAPS